MLKVIIRAIFEQTIYWQYTFSLQHNSRVESIDIEDNGLTEEAIVHIVEALRHNIHITNLVINDDPFSLKYKIFSPRGETDCFSNKLPRNSLSIKVQPKYEPKVLYIQNTFSVHVQGTILFVKFNHR